MYAELLIIRTEQLTYGMVCYLVDVGSFRL